MDLTTPAFWNLQRGYNPPAGDSAAGVTSNVFYLAQGASAVPPTGVNPIAAAFWGSGSQSILTKDPFPQPVVSGGDGGDGGGGEQPESGEYSKLVLAASPAMYLKCNESTGSTLTDSSGNGHDGTTEVPLEAAMAPDLNPDNKDEGWAADYGAVNLNVGYTSWGFHFQNPLELGTGKAWTVEFLFQYEQNEEDIGYLLQLGATGNVCPSIVVLPTTAAGFKIRVDFSGRALATSTATYSLSKTHILHLIQHADGSPTQLLIDGVEALHFTYAFGDYLNGPSAAGHANPGGYPSVGTIDEFALYQSALTPADIAARVAIVAPPPVFNPTYTVNFDETVQPNWLTVVGGTAVLDGGLLKLRETTADIGNMRSTHNIGVPQSNVIQMRVKRVAGTDWEGMLYWFNGNHDACAPFVKHVDVPAGIDAGFVTLEWDMRTLTAADLADWNSGVSALRFDLGNAFGGEFHIDWIKAGYYSEVE